MEHMPSWEELRSRKYCKLTSHSLSGVSHGKIWEDSKVNRLHTLRLSSDYVAALKRRPGPKGRRSSRVIGATPDDSYIQRGQRPNGLPHQIRGELNKLFQCEPSFINAILRESMDYNPSKRVRVNLNMPNLSLAVKEVYEKMTYLEPKLHSHPAFKRFWAPAVCRLLEIKWRHEESIKVGRNQS